MSVFQEAAKAPPFLRAALYKRVSTIDQAEEGYSLDAQERVLRTYCADHGYEVYDVYADEGISGKDIKHRPQMRRLLEDADAKAFDIILVWALSRLTRSVADLYNTWARISAQGIGLISYTEAFDTSTPTGRAMMGLLGVFAQMEREITAERVATAMEERALRGMRTCVEVLGYDSIPGGGLRINAHEAKTVQYIFTQYLECHNMVEVARRCNAARYHGKRGKPFQPESIHKVLTRFIYCGYYRWHGRPIAPSSGWEVPSIISPQDYNRVQRIMLQRDTGRIRRHDLVMLGAGD